MNEKAFNLFTALLSFILIILTVLLLNAMLQAEGDAQSILSSTSEQSRLEAVLELTRADALQIFNHAMRVSIEEYMALNEITFERDKWQDWDALIEDVRVGKFGGQREDETETTAFASLMASNLVSLYSSSDFGAVGSYDISIDTKSQKNLRDALKDILTADDSFLQVVGCENGKIETCEKGTFYLELDMSVLSDEDYETKIPKIVLKDNSTSRTIRDPVLPKTKIRLYVPLRLFKAIAYSRAMAFNVDALEVNNTVEDYGLLSLRMHNEFDSMALGLCDPGYCKARTNPYYPPISKSSTEACPFNEPRVNDYYENNPIRLDPDETLSFTNVSKYNPTPSARDSGKQLGNIVIDRACEIAEKQFTQVAYGGKSLEELAGETFELKGTSDCSFISKAVAGSNSRISKRIAGSGGSGGGGRNVSVQRPNLSFANPNSICPLSSAQLADSQQMGWGGLYFNPNTGKHEKPDTSGMIFFNDADFEDFAECAQLETLRITIEFQEKDERYKVSESDLTYKFVLADDYVPFNPNMVIGEPDAACSLQMPFPSPNYNENDWTCRYGGSAGGLSEGGTISGCYPA